MTIKLLCPYLILDGTANEAITLYERVLGAKAENIKRFGDLPGMDDKDDATKKRVMHARIAVGGTYLMLGDAMPSGPAPVAGNVSVSLAFTDAGDLQKAFDALAEGGTVAAPVHDAFWGGKFGNLVDKFGVDWMFAIEP